MAVELKLNPIYGKEKILLVRRLNDIATKNAIKPLLQIEHTITMERDSDSVATKDGNITTTSGITTELEYSGLSNRDETNSMMYAAFKADETLEFWDVDIKKKNAEGKYWMQYMRGKLTNWELPDNVEDMEEFNGTVAVDGIPVEGWGTLPESVIIETNAAYGFVDTTPQTVVVTVTPETSNTAANTSTQFTSTGGDVIWSVSPTQGATISATGLLTLDGTATGTYTVTATSTVDPNAKDTAVVTVA